MADVAKVESGELSPADPIVAETDELKNITSTAQIIPMSDTEAPNGALKEDTRGIIFSGMSKTELMAFANDPFWVRLRWFLLILFWVTWIGMLVAAIAIVVSAPKCSAAPPKQWFQKSALNVIKLEDLPGTESKLQELRDLLPGLADAGVSSLVLPPLYNQDVNGALNFTELNPDLGTEEELTELLNDANDKDIKVIMDFQPNHVSKNHVWFKDSSSASPITYKNYFVWTDAVDPPNNWLNEEDAPAWYASANRRGRYYNSKSKDQPDLNFRDRNVQLEFEKIVNFWFDKGLHGLRVLDANRLVEDEQLEDEIPVGGKAKASSYSDLIHDKTLDQNDTMGILGTWADIAASYDSGPRVIVIDTSDSPPRKLSMYQGAAWGNGIIAVDLVDASVEDQSLFREIKEHVKSLGADGWPAWQWESTEGPSLATRFGSDVQSILMAAYLLPGTPLISEAQGAPDRALQKFLAENLRDKPTILGGETHFLNTSDDVFGFIRTAKGNPGYLMIGNFGDSALTVNGTASMSCLTGEAEVLVQSNVEPYAVTSRPKVALEKIELQKNEGMILQFIPRECNEEDEAP